MLLKCIGFDMDFYRDFVDAARTYSAAFGVATIPAAQMQAPSASPAPPADAGQKRPAESRFQIEGTPPPPKRRRVSKTPASATATPRRSGRLSIMPPPSGLASAGDDDDADADGISSDSGTEFNADDE